MPTVPGWVYLFSRGRAAQICVAGRSGHRGRAVTCPLHGPRFSRLGDVIHVYRPPWFCELNPDCEETSPKACFFGSPQYVVIGKSAAGTLHLRTGEKRRSDIENSGTGRFLGCYPKATRTHAGYGVFDPQVLHHISFVQKSKTVGLTLREIKRVLETVRRGKNPCPQVVQWVDEKATAL
jgi:hypothetical protein